MSLDYTHILIIGGALVILSLLAGRFFSRMGISSLLVTLSLGMVLGNGGVYDFDYNYPEVTLRLSEIALSLIIFTGGFHSVWHPLRPWVSQGVSLATLGVLLTAATVGGIIHLVLHWPPERAFLLGAVVSSTDAAAVFSILKKGGYELKAGIGQTLELESGTNDPMAYFLTLSLTELSLNTEASMGHFSIAFLISMGVGVISGLLIGRTAVIVLQKAKLEPAQNAVLLLAFIITLYGINQLTGGSSFLAVYTAGMVVGNSEWKKLFIRRFFDGLSWLNETVLFLILGLQVYLFQLEEIFLEGLMVAGVLIFIARPLGTWVSLSFFKNRSWRQKTFISWVGLRGATPIVFGLVPIVYQVPEADAIFDISFIVVISSILFQGMTVGLMAGWTGVKSNHDE